MSRFQLSSSPAAQISKNTWSWPHITYALLGCAAIFAMVQAGAPSLVGFDGYFHIRFSELLRHEGYIDRLPWLYHTVHRDFFRDHHLLWHYLLIPFTFGDLISGGQLAVFVFALFMAMCLYAVFAGRGVPLPYLWTFAALLSSHPFLYRMSMLRVQSVSLAVLCLLFLFCAWRRYWVIGLLSVVYVWLYDAYPLVVLTAGVFALFFSIEEKKPEVKLLGAALGGVLIGIIVNPHFPENVSSILYNASRSLFLDVPGIHLGNEWEPYDTWFFLTHSAPAFVVFFAVIFLSGRQGKLGVDEYAALVLNVFFMVLSMKSRRFIEYWPIFSCLSGGLILGRRLPQNMIVYGFLALFPLMVINMRQARNEVTDCINPNDFKGAALWLKDNSAPGEIVFNADWDNFPFLFFYNQQNYYVVGLDPMYLYTYSPDKSKLYREITRGKFDNPAQVIADEFQARYAFAENNQKRFIERMKEDPSARVVFQDAESVVFAIADVSPAAKMQSPSNDRQNLD